MADRKKKRIIILAILCCAAVILTVLILRRGGREDNSIFQAAEESKTMHTVQKNEKCAMENSRFQTAAGVPGTSVTYRKNPLSLVWLKITIRHAIIRRISMCSALSNYPMIHFYVPPLIGILMNFMVKFRIYLSP